MKRTGWRRSNIIALHFLYVSRLPGYPDNILFGLGHTKKIHIQHITYVLCLTEFLHRVLWQSYNVWPRLQSTKYAVRFCFPGHSVDSGVMFLSILLGQGHSEGFVVARRTARFIEIYCLLYITGDINLGIRLRLHQIAIDKKIRGQVHLERME